MFAILMVIGLICLLPTLWIALSGFKVPSEMYAIPPMLLPSHINLSDIANVWNKVNVAKYFSNSLMLVIGCWAFDIVVNGLARYVLSRIKPMSSKLIETLVFWSMLLPGMSNKCH